MSKHKSSKKKIKFIKKWCKWFYKKTNSFNYKTLGADLTYLFMAIIEDKYVFIHKDDENEMLNLLKEYQVSKYNKIWKYIKIEK
jgi:hypothetical protein